MNKEAPHPRPCERYLDSFDSLVDGSAGESERAEFEAHRFGCADCAQAFEQRQWLHRTLASFAAREGRSRVAAPAELDLRVARASDSGEFVRLMLRHVPPVGAPSALDERVLGTPGDVARPRRFVLVGRTRDLVRIAVAAAALFAVSAVAFTLASRPARPRNFTLAARGADEIPVSIQPAIDFLAGAAPESR